MRFLARDWGIEESWRPFRAPTNRAFESRGVAPGWYSPALSAREPQSPRFIARLYASKYLISSQSSSGPTRKKLFLRMQDEFLHAPVQQFADVDFVFRRARDFVNPPE